MCRRGMRCRTTARRAATPAPASGRCRAATTAVSTPSTPSLPHPTHSYRRGSGSGGDLTPDKQPETGGSIEISEEQFQFVADNTAAKGSARLQRAFTRFHGHIFSPRRPHSQLAAAAAGAGAEQQGSRAEGAPLFTLDVELGSANESLGLGVDESYSLSIETTVGWGSIGRLSAPTICNPNGVSGCLDARAGCFLALVSGLRLVGTVSARR